jgi:hypothetical protein
VVVSLILGKVGLSLAIILTATSSVQLNGVCSSVLNINYYFYEKIYTTFLNLVVLTLTYYDIVAKTKGAIWRGGVLKSIKPIITADFGVFLLSLVYDTAVLTCWKIFAIDLYAQHITVYQGFVLAFANNASGLFFEIYHFLLLHGQLKRQASPTFSSTPVDSDGKRNEKQLASAPDTTNGGYSMQYSIPSHELETLDESATTDVDLSPTSRYPPHSSFNQTSSKGSANTYTPPVNRYENSRTFGSVASPQLAPASYERQNAPSVQYNQSYQSRNAQNPQYNRRFDEH